MSGYFVLNKCLGSINFDPDPGSALEKWIWIQVMNISLGLTDFFL